MPYGCFLEIEGKSADAIKAAAARLGLDWNTRCIDSYMVLFNRMQENLSIRIANLTFAEMKALKVGPDDLGLAPADTLSQF